MWQNKQKVDGNGWIEDRMLNQMKTKYKFAFEWNNLKKTKKTFFCSKFWSIFIFWLCRYVDAAPCEEVSSFEIRVCKLSVNMENFSNV